MFIFLFIIICLYLKIQSIPNGKLLNLQDFRTIAKPGSEGGEEKNNSVSRVTVAMIKIHEGRGVSME